MNNSQCRPMSEKNKNLSMDVKSLDLKYSTDDCIAMYFAKCNKEFDLFIVLN